MRSLSCRASSCSRAALRALGGERRDLAERPQRVALGSVRGPCSGARSAMITPIQRPPADIGVQTISPCISRWWNSSGSSRSTSSVTSTTRSSASARRASATCSAVGDGAREQREVDAVRADRAHLPALVVVGEDHGPAHRCELARRRRHAPVELVRWPGLGLGQQPGEQVQRLDRCREREWRFAHPGSIAECSALKTNARSEDRAIEVDAKLTA